MPIGVILHCGLNLCPFYHEIEQKTSRKLGRGRFFAKFVPPVRTVGAAKAGGSHSLRARILRLLQVSTIMPATLFPSRVRFRPPSEDRNRAMSISVNNPPTEPAGPDHFLANQFEGTGFETIDGGVISVEFVQEVQYDDSPEGVT